LEVYVPEQMSREAIEEIVRATIGRVGASGAGEKGKVMGPLMGELRGKADGRLVNEVVTELLGD
ncbi:MAG TPA: GatB/YqeY domain-containing protein, partial [Dehalococcoidia bacterium]|nr:GatB/YqeY domain-containing protein [Dehalococcoidia bacterium]